MLLINCEISLIVTCYAHCVISNSAANQDKIFAVTDTKLYVSVVISSTQDNAKLLQQIKSEFKRTMN